ncbi:YjhX family toxin [Rhizobium sp. L1K21]|uniref:YjhX family toxin n=1 Tax=Rhizobium sp. L1K21 TaxID=2954933 RepID=UPI0020923D41|nr:YjhX family toxin [Rhizobium sp. L1K21]MCO6186445.1 YjhX family toxin [Rhizobium sp. L1K21]
MDISRLEQRILHLMAQGGWIEIIREDDSRKISEIHCYTRDGWRYPGLTMRLFRKLKSNRAIASANGKPYRITRRGLELVRAQLDNR